MMRAAVSSFFLLALSCAAEAAPTVVIVNPSPITPLGAEYFVSSTPAAHAQLSSPPDSVTITVSRQLATSGNSIQLFNVYGTPVNDGQVTVNGTQMTANLPALDPGQYRVQWKARCACRAPLIAGEFKFMVQ